MHAAGLPVYSFRYKGGIGLPPATAAAGGGPVAASSISGPDFLGGAVEFDFDVAAAGVCGLGVNTTLLLLDNPSGPCDGPLYQGVMAQDLLSLRSHAVTVCPNGFMAVDYGELDVEFKYL